ncbi:double homeobox protein 4-like [Grammomys surdaster]|uniref:double homeobox protein 4-like n=1 Tax=Grammomys surdaster TaxID=491861 RepID=UPI00109FDBC6|nr:double homeobox protein 4-like [Grammomys surdaster]
MEAGSNVDVSSVARESPRRKTVWQAWQEQALLSAFSKSKYLSFAARQDLAGQMGVTDSRIRVWFQNRRSRTGAVGHAPNRSTAGSRKLASRKLQKEFGSRAQGGGMPSDHRRPRTRITLPQSRILLEAFERNPRPGFATREELAQRTGLPEDTIHIWFQNRRVRHINRGRPAAQGQDLLDSRGEDEAPGGPGGREHEGVPDSLLQLVAAGVTDTSNPSDLPTFCTEAQPSQLEERLVPEQEEAPNQGSTKGTLQLLLCQQLDQIQAEDLVPAPLNLHGVLGGRELEGAQDSLLPLAPARGVSMDDTSNPSDLSAFCTECPTSQLQEPSGPAQAHAPTQASNPDPLDFFLDQVLTQVQVDEHSSAHLELEAMDTTPELPLTQEDYQALLDML